MEADKSTTILMARDISKEESIAHANILMGTATETISDLESPVHSCVESILRSDGDDDDEDLIFQEVKMILRKRRGWGPEDSLSANDLDLLEYDDELVEEDDAGCPLPSTPEDTQLIEAEMTEVLKAGVLSDEIDLGALAHNAAEQAEEFVRKVWEASWMVCHYKNLPKWLQDNDFLHRGHRPPLPSFSACFKSIFRVHTETGNIWTHLLGCVAFIGVALYFLSRPSVEIQIQEKIIFGAFFAGAIICLGFSFAFHTLSCHSVEIGRLFSKLDYCGIALLIMGSFVPWLYYGFYCHYQPKVIYLSVVCVLGSLSIIVSLWDKFSEPGLRPLRAGVFMSFGLSGIIPAIHYSLMEGWFSKISQASLGWLILMGLLYILGAMLYALRVPERWFPGKFDIWFQSHQLFHILVIAAAFVHYHGISEMAMYRVTVGECTVPHEPITF
ncbi:adiponectin receptor protein isoform X1 [Bactrocera oleae]|uniref:adiponectin receptor protein isoform X1 n=1 Tax=Bactrocera oleae TaxID=104688 RepID=UPI0006B7AED2|nr:adiponectin receptor protein [Bactrocera oleae]XP_014097339.1 adiponectin receptor protein [Bactrocera oleae]XP_014097340.1 adiponectin receptor protein [Bactrocera oleae]XP_036217332.1 adiponectin receptor protein [Bactrocera oleae]XP_036217333.1 adiponectin receptor protein [Bactrocera oleae]XP_036217334.1 adiponectin receptor protein [Bactrocera oleae]XP_036217335.1 adiponectin receptor protein [Bactrocera oleae]